MNDPPTTNSEPRPKPRRLWPWVAGLIVLSFCAIGVAVWQKVHQVRQLQEFARRSPQGKTDIEYNHPPWADPIVSRQTYLPWSDGLVSFLAPNKPISEELFSALLQQRSLRSVHIDVSECSPELISELGQLTHLESVILVGNHKPIPLEWTKKLFRLDELTFHNIPIPPDEWPMLVSLPHMSGLSWSETHTYVSDFAGAPYLMITKDHLTRADAEALATVKGLTFLELTYTEADPEFWATFSKLPDLYALRLTSDTPRKAELSPSELEALKRISSLKTLQLINHVDLEERSKTLPAWQKFVEERPDVKVDQSLDQSR